MDRMLYVAMSAARQTMQQQATNNHNLANVDTTGFRAQVDAFGSLPVYGPGHPGRVYGENFRVGFDDRPGTIVSTGNALDVAVEGDGFIAVLDRDGEEAYTRAGALRVSPSGVLETAAGQPVLGNGGPITLTPYQDIEIGTDGTISLRPLGQAAGERVQLDRIRLVNPAGGTLERTAEGLFRSTEGVAAPDASVSLRPGALEGSNVNAVDAMVTMIELARRYEMQVKMMGTAEKNDEAAARLLRM